MIFRVEESEKSENEFLIFMQYSSENGADKCVTIKRFVSKRSLCFRFVAICCVYALVWVCECECECVPVRMCGSFLLLRLQSESIC